MQEVQENNFVIPGVVHLHTYKYLISDISDCMITVSIHIIYVVLVYSYPFEIRVLSESYLMGLAVPDSAEQWHFLILFVPGQRQTCLIL